MVTKKFICKNCGAVNVAEITEKDLTGPGDDDDDWLNCVLPTSFEWSLPAGKITPLVGDPIYISAGGEQLSREDYLMKYNIDPEIAYQLMRGRIVRSYAYMASDSQKKGRARASASQAIKFSMIDDDDWTA